LRGAARIRVCRGGRLSPRAAARMPVFHSMQTASCIFIPKATASSAPSLERPAFELNIRHIKQWVLWFPRQFWDSLGPGLISGAADDDPSGITTYSVAGARFGTHLLWTALLTWPLMAAVQMMWARIGIVSGRGMAAAFRAKF